MRKNDDTRSGRKAATIKHHGSWSETTVTQRHSILAFVSTTNPLQEFS